MNNLIILIGPTRGIFVSRDIGGIDAYRHVKLDISIENELRSVRLIDKEPTVYLWGGKILPVEPDTKVLRDDINHRIAKLKEELSVLEKEAVVYNNS